MDSSNSAGAGANSDPPTDAAKEATSSVEATPAAATNTASASTHVNPFLPLQQQQKPEAAAAAAADPASSAAPTPSQSENTSDVTAAAAATSGSGFVFGQNLSARASNFEERQAGGQEEQEEDKGPDKEQEGGEGERGRDEEDEKKAECGNTVVETGGIKSLSESAAEYSRSKAPKRKYEEVKVCTGEEGENNVLQLSGKLHVFDKTAKNWAERGRGVLRLNDGGDEEAGDSRLVMRTSGSLRVILNTPVFRGMTAEAPSERTVRLTGTDDGGQLRIFLVTTTSRDAAALLVALRERIEALDSAPPSDETAAAVAGDDEGEVAANSAAPQEDQDNDGNDASLDPAKKRRSE